MSEAVANINLTDNTLENIKIMAPLLDEASQNQVFGIMLGMVKVKNEKKVQPTLNDMRKEHGLEPIDGGDTILTKVQSGNTLL